MSSNAYIKLVPSSSQQAISTEELKNLFHYYKEITTKTGDQVDWNYENSAFPYDLKEKEDGKGKWFYLQSSQDRYSAILIGVDTETVFEEDGTGREQSYIQITLPPTATAGDKGKANEFSKFIGKKLQGELHLFNGRVMYFYPRK
ncbi:DUF1885 family protein [Mesobacillus jeotgali]|jgi:hypothetical protein|uniref:DUF1885 family protein n=1 Tax=Mesobacillus jeotgali TaxID=129985 RepID=A0ABY9VN99_9BACI|nr:DUF1885 family protein [Mesobacillus jeotgali]WNF24322.1 DUF1885 family protein [Mesobacillus jeotgali]